jgi:two-component system sensor histidine kinase ChvG
LKLRTQAATLSLVLLVIPLLATEFLRNHQQALLTLQQQAVESTAKAVAATLNNNATALYPDENRLITPLEEESLLVGRLRSRPTVDGSLNEWSAIPQRTFGTTRRPFTVSLAADKTHLYMAIVVTEETKVYSSGDANQDPRGDRLMLTTWQNHQRQQYVITADAPGPVVARSHGRELSVARPNAVKGVWMDTQDGYQIELQMPADITQSRLGIYYVDVDEGGISTRGNSKPLDTTAPPWLVETPATLAAFADYADNHNIMLRIHDRWGWPLIASRALQDPAPKRVESWVSAIQKFVVGIPDPNLNVEYAESGRETSRDIVNALRGLPEPSLVLKNGQLIARYATPVDSDAGVMGVVVAEQPLQIARWLSADGFQKLLLQTAIAFILVAGCLIGFTILLGRRIERIDSHIAEAMLAGVGPSLSTGWLNDEIDQLTNRLNTQLEEQRRLQGYLRRLPASLSHEIRTPVAVIRSTLDLLSDTENTDGSLHADLIARARASLERLGHIIAIMNEANRLEKAIYVDERQPTDLKNLLSELTLAYGSTYPKWTFRLQSDDREAMAPVSPDLIVQALDKLVSNAMSFSRPGETITLQLERRGLWWRITVSNPGENLPEAREDLFAPMVSARTVGEEHHLGLGLYMVALIAKHHGGEPWARNTPDYSGAEVGFTVRA